MSSTAIVFKRLGEQLELTAPHGPVVAGIHLFQDIAADRIAALVPPPRVHRHRYHGVLAPNSPLRAQVTALAEETTGETASTTEADDTDGPDSPTRSPARDLWATLIPKPFTTDELVVNCHHNYVQKERHYGEDVWVTRKGAVRAGVGEMGIIPGSMGARSFIVRGRGNAESFCSCSHGAGRVYSRTEAKRRFTLEDQKRATEGVECRKDAAVIDEIPMAYKDIDAVIHAQRDLVEMAYTLRQVICVKG